MKRRPDIQGIRGLAIAAVLAFHLNEATFPAGFAGVDMFFVLSGYLMSVILSKESEFSFSVLKDFYTRRFKRIVPLYAMLIALLAVIVPCYLLRRDVQKFCADVVWAALFGTNVHSVLEETDYFTELFDSNVLTHTWSLGVEIQYYLIVPFIVLSQRILASKCERFPFIHLVFFASLAYQMFSTINVAFNLLPSRVWQFLAGGIAHEISPSVHIEDVSSSRKKDFSEAMESLSTDFLSFSLICLILWPWNHFLSPTLAVLLTSVLLVLGDNECRQGLLLTNRPLVYLGDISYLVYLAHWPIIIMWKSVTDSSFYEIVCCLTLTFTISIVIHHTVELYFIRADVKIASVLVAILYAFLAIALIFNIPLEINNRMRGAASADIAAAIEWNDRESHTGYYKKRPFKECVDDPEGLAMRGGYSGHKYYECVWKPKNATGHLKILVMGNSIANRAIKILKSVIEKNFPQVSLVRQYVMNSCRPLEQAKGCPPYYKAIPAQVRAMKPDITFYIYDDSKRLRAPLLTTNDSATGELAAFLRPMANASRFLVLDEFYPLPATSTGVATSMHKRLSRNQPTLDLKGTFESFHKDYANYFARLDRIRIPNLVRHNTSAALCGEEKGWCWWYNRRNFRSYFTDNRHLSPEGLELMRDSYTNILKTLIARL